MGLFGELQDFADNPLNYFGSAIGKLNHLATKESWDYQTRNAYQNTVYDLRQAGLNPMMAFGNGANSASVSQASTSQLPNVIASAQQVAGLDKTMAEAKLASASARQTAANASVAEKVADYYDKTPDAIANKVQTADAPKTTVQGISNLGQKFINAVRSPQGKQVVDTIVGSSSGSAKEFAGKLNKLGGMIRGLFTGTPGSGSIPSLND